MEGPGPHHYIFNAPAVIVAHAPSQYVWAPVDCAIAVTYLELVARTDGLARVGFMIYFSICVTIISCIKKRWERNKTITGTIMTSSAPTINASGVKK